MSSQRPVITSATRWLQHSLPRADGDVTLTSPYLAYDTCRQVASAASDSSWTWRLMTALDPSAVANGYLSVQGMRTLLQAGVEVFHVDRLHAKCFVVGTRAMLGSANLTGAGLGSSASPNRELGVELAPEQAREALEAISEWPVWAVNSDDLEQLEQAAQALTKPPLQTTEESLDARSALQMAETILADARDEDRSLWLKLEYDAPKCDGWKKASFFASPKKGRPGFRPGELVFICAKEWRDCYAVAEVTSEPEFQPGDCAEVVAEDRPGDLERWPWINRTVPRLVPDGLRELKLDELGVQGRALQNGHVRLRFDQFTAGIRALARLTSG